MSYTRLLTALVPGLFFVGWGGFMLLLSCVVPVPLWLEVEVFCLSSVSYTMPLYIDHSIIGFSCTVALIAGMVCVYSSAYMSGERYLGRFLWLVTLFVMSMNLLIFIPGLWALMLGWDGLGVTSFCLVVYYQSPSALAGGMLTALSNRIGDVLLLVALFLGAASEGHFFLAYYDGGGLFWVCVVLAAFTKSAQFPFCAWLPAAMCAPTPVSALVHSSTLVTAGVFLLIRAEGALDAPMRSVVGAVSLLTLLLSSLAANVVLDLKKIIALSTLSQLAIMMQAVAVGLPTLALLHLLTHALLKAALFMAAGNMIYSSGTQDIRHMGGVSRSLPVTSTCSAFAFMALAGLPFIGAFFSKDLIYEGLLSAGAMTPTSALAVVSAGLTVSYSARVSASVFSGGSAGLSSLSLSSEAPASTWTVVVLLLATLIVPPSLGGVEVSFNHWVGVGGLSLAVPLCMVGGVGGFILYWARSRGASKSLYLSSMLGLQPLSGFVASPLLCLCTHIHRRLDMGWSEVGGGEGVWASVVGGGHRGHLFQTVRFNTLFLWWLVFTIGFWLKYSSMSTGLALLQQPDRVLRGSGFDSNFSLLASLVFIFYGLHGCLGNQAGV